MNPAIVIPTYWTADSSAVESYDHTTPVSAKEPDLARCLESLEQVKGVMRTFILLVAPPGVEGAARKRVDEIAGAHPGLNPLVIGREEARPIQNAVVNCAPRLSGEAVGLRGYGAIKNMGLLCCAVFGHDVAVFLDDDEVVLNDQFLIDAVYGLGQLTKQNLPVVAKTGYWVDKEGNYLSKGNPSPTGKKTWEDKYWNKSDDFNDWMRHALATTRISRSNTMYGGCMSIHAEAFSRVGFDPYITRGEDLDYLFNLRLYGMDVWFDNHWRVLHLPPATPDPANRFRQNIYRWMYEREKLGYASAKIDLKQVTPQSLMPYPGRFLTSDLESNIRRTALFRALKYQNHKEYFQIFIRGVDEARVYAQRYVEDYLTFQSFWPGIVSTLWESRPLEEYIYEHGFPEALKQENPYQTSVEQPSEPLPPVGDPDVAPAAPAAQGAPTADLNPAAAPDTTPTDHA